MATTELITVESRTKRTGRFKILGISLETKAVRAVMVAYLVSRLVIIAIILFSSTVIPMRQGDYLYSNPDNMVLDGLVRDDSWWYYNIASRGYSMGSIQTGEQGNAAFFPLYPLTIKMVSGLTGNAFIAGIVVSNVCFLLALSFLYGLVRREFNEESAARTVFYYATAPTAVFFSAMYTESLYMMLVIGTFYFARLRLWDRAALMAALASSTRNTGVLLAAVIALEGIYWQGGRFKPSGWRKPALIKHFKSLFVIILKSWRSLIAAAFAPLGLILYMSYLANTFGDPLGFIHVQATWGRDASGAGFTKLIGDTAKRLNAGPNIWAGQIHIDTLVNLLTTLVFLPLVIVTFKKLRPSYAVYSLLTFLIPLSTGSVGSMTRYILMLIPCFMLLGNWGRFSWVDRIIVGISLPFMAYFTIIFSHWYFAG